MNDRIPPGSQSTVTFEHYDCSMPGILEIPLSRRDYTLTELDSMLGEQTR